MWWFVRRVPTEFAELDKRVIVQQSTKVRCADDPNAIRARQRMHELNGDLERFWRDLAKGGDTAQAVQDYAASIKAARKLGLSQPIDDSAKRTTDDLLARIERLEAMLSNVSAGSARAEVLATYDAAPKPDITFRECAAQFIATQRSGWKNAKHAAQWESTLATYAYPVIGDVPVKRINGNGDGTEMILKIIKPMWHDTTETANRVRGRIEQVLNWATAHDFREGANPARWKGHLDKLLPARSKVAPVKHHAAMPFADVPGFMQKLRAMQGTAARALEFLILTASRTSEVLGARRSEIDLHARMWIVPASRMKAKKEHRVPLSDAAIRIVKAMPDGDLLFAGSEGRPMSNMAMLKLLGRMGVRGKVVTHGFRSAFRDWASETTSYPNEMLEMALAHVIDNKAERAYRRGDLLKKRHQLMQDWSSFCG
jgi:integrase